MKVHVLKNPDGLEEGENYITAYDNIYKEQVAVDYANGNGFNPDIAVKIKENGDWVITKVIWCGKGGLDSKRIQLQTYLLKIIFERWFSY